MKRIRKKNTFSPVYWCLLGAATVALDHLTGPYIRFPILFLLPVMLAAWYDGRRWGWGLAIALPLIQEALIMAVWTHQVAVIETIINALVRITVLSLVAFLVDRTAKHERELETEVKTLKGILPICSHCKKIRTPENTWEQLEKYISDHSDSQFSHGICPECRDKYYGEEFRPPFPQVSDP